MPKKKINKLMNKCDVWRLIRIALAGGIITSAAALVLELVMPLRLNNDTVDTSTVNTVAANYLPKILQPRRTGIHEVAKIIRVGLFKSETSLRDKPMADKTIERIKSQLELQCIMELNGEPVAYVNIKGIGMKKCKIGDSVNDLFTVLNIGKKSIEITIVGHREILSL